MTICFDLPVLCYYQTAESVKIVRLLEALKDGPRGGAAGVGENTNTGLFIPG